MECELAYVKTENKLLKDDNERMKRILNNDSSNSSNPPSSDNKGNRPNQYNTRKKQDKKCGGQKGEYRFYSDIAIPIEHRSSVVYGPTIRTYAVDLYGEGAMSIKRISNFLNGIGEGMKLSTGSIYSFLQDFGRKAETYIESISKELLNSQVLYRARLAKMQNKAEGIGLFSKTKRK